jgi:hypothetical protein
MLIKEDYMSSQPEKFSFAIRDEYQRKPIAERIMGLLVSDINVSPMVINGNWGTGKTEFCKKLINLIDESESYSKYKTVYINAFQAEYANDPIMTLLSAVLKIMPTEKEKKDLRQKIMPILRLAGKTFAKAGVSWLLRDNMEDLTGSFSEILNDKSDEFIDRSIELLIKDHAEVESGIITLKKLLNDSSKKNPIVIFIDEIDRCRPDFALDILEKIKHIFDVDGIQFVFVANINELISSINHIYGKTLDAQRYLDKFLKFNFTLPDLFKDQSDGFHASVAHFQTFIEKLPSNKLFPAAYTQELEFVKTLIVSNRLSLREVETFSRYLDIYLHLTKGMMELDRWTMNGNRLLTILGIYLTCFHPEKGRKLMSEKANSHEIIEVLGKDNVPSIDSSITISHCIDLVCIAIDMEIQGIGVETLPETARAGLLCLFSNTNPGQKIRVITSAMEVLQLNFRNS